MKCPHCNVSIKFEVEDDYSSYWFDDEQQEVRGAKGPGHGIEYNHCPNCNQLIVQFLRGTCKFEYGNDSTVIYENDVESVEVIYPRYSIRSVESEVPERFRTDFLEASAVLSVSPKASAALSRRILQDVLREKFSIKKANLQKEIEEFINLPDVPSFLRQAIDAVRQVGNFAAHPLKDTNTGEIVGVEPGEAEWLLDVLEALFDFAFVQPVRLAEKTKKLNEKLQNLGKPPMQTKP